MLREVANASLLWDCVRVATRLLHRMARRKPSLRKHFSDHTRRAKRRAYAIKFQRRRQDILLFLFGQFEPLSCRKIVHAGRKRAGADRPASV